MTFYHKIREIEVENSGICNAACPQCIREIKPGDHSWFEEGYLHADIFDRIPDDIYKNLEILRFAGSIGDPCAAPNFIEVVKRVRTKGTFKINISTNGGMKSPDWWTRLAQALGPDDEVQFALDGLSDTNSIYRVNVSWKKAMENAQAFIAAGGNAFWQFIVFQHNEHQVDDGRKLAEDMGFKKFIVKPSHRFLMDDIMGVKRYGTGGVLIQPPGQKELIHKVMFQPKVVKVEDLLKNSNDSCIKCYAKEHQDVYIDFTGHIFPCCFMASSYWAQKHISVPDGWKQLWNDAGGDLIDLHKQDWDTIVQGEFFNQVEKRWDKDYNNGRLLICSGVCSSFEGRFNDPAEFGKLATTEFKQSQ